MTFIVRNGSGWVRRINRREEIRFTGHRERAQVFAEGALYYWRDRGFEIEIITGRKWDL